MRWLYAVGYLSKMPHTDKNDMCETNYRFFLFHLVYTTHMCMISLPTQTQTILFILIGVIVALTCHCDCKKQWFEVY